MELSGTSAIITGGASGLGAATARRLAADGAVPVILDLNEHQGQSLADELGGAFVLADVTDSDRVTQGVAVAAEAGALRSVVNCAGIGWAQRTLTRDGTPHDLETFRRTIEINLIGTFNVIRLAAAAMAATEAVDEFGQRGAIVNTSSVAGIEGQTGQAAYSGSKGGVIGITLPIARDLSPVGVRVNTICPGLMNTPLMNVAPPDVLDGLNNSVLFPKRMGSTGEFASMAHELLTNDYMNGSVIRLDGGIRFQPK
ncbi:MAG: SDR family NAD(P)-dependent oxidoreductase [Acidimicrobiia bacterium]|nr:SDR family NAD(P)-dependent oxidoreductase [Acidimicrobiia bacterium]